jgi:hypothetical protein
LGDYVFVKSSNKSFGFGIRNRVQIVQVLNLLLITVAEISNELIDVIGNNVFGMFFLIAFQIE